MVDRCEICGVLLRPGGRPRKATCERGACAQEYRRRIDRTPGARGCPVCGRLVAGKAETCGEDYCRGEAESRRARQRREREREAARQSAAERIEKELQESRGAPPEARAAVLPATDRPLVAMDPSRRTLFRERLSGLLEDAAADPDGPTGEAPQGEQPVSAVDALSRAACASCRGHCCRHGEPHAFLRPATLRRYRKGHPHASPHQVLEAYLGRIPPVSVAGSCIYHGPEGCALPRSMRSDVCNLYFCDDLERLQAAVPSGGPPGPVLAVGFDGDRLVRVSVLEANQATPIAYPPR